MEKEIVIEVKDVTKDFKLYTDKGKMLKERLLFRGRSRYELRKVLKGISFNVRQGEAIGLIGSNGCGKSTTLKLLSKIIYPNNGSIVINGRVSSLIELGAGFHPDMSGRENIYINASIFGLSRKEIDNRLEDIIAFSELEDYIDNPVRTYSSGMYMRLAFSVAINVDADVLLIDEILAVGDANFQAKCFNKLREIKANGTTIVIVSHSLGQIEQICERSIWIDGGIIREEGTPREVHPMYLDYMGQKRQENVEKEAERLAAKEEKNQKENIHTEDVIEVKEEKETNKRWGNGKARILSIHAYDNSGQKKSVFETGSDITLRIEFEVYEEVKDAVVGIGIFRSDGVYCYGSNTRLDKMQEFNLSKNGMAEIRMKNVMLMPGQYNLDFAIESEIGVPVDYYREALMLEMYSTKNDVGLVRVEHDWEIN